MCGICGGSWSGGARREELARMAQALAHRGPDDEGIEVRGPVGLASRRLAIIDLAGGHQPLANEDGTVWVAFNGEIYNHRALRAELERAGHRFATHSDTEVIVHCYEQHGEAFLGRLEGMFALAIWDEPRGRLLLARDRMGQKPLFYARTAEGLLFASEIKGILAAGSLPRELDAQALSHYLSLRFVPPPRTMFAGIEKLPAGHFLLFESGRLQLRRYWRLSFARKLALPEAEALEAIAAQLEHSVASHLVSDVDIGALLSGGMDSSLIVALASRAWPGRLRTFSIGVRDRSFDELPHARRVAAHCETAHFEEIVEPDVISSLPAMIAHLDEPSDPIAACMFAASALAARHVKVALGGDGGDELFAGFDRYLGVRRLEPLFRIPAALRGAVLGPLVDMLPESFAYKSWTQRLRWVAALSRVPDLAERYAQATVFFRFDTDGKRAALGEALWRRVRDVDSADVVASAFREADSDDAIDCMLHADYTTRLPEHSLQLTDRMSMAHGLEVRAPLLDTPLVELLASLPSALKIRGGELKWAMRRVAGARLPADIVRRPKQGFMFPLADWFRTELHVFLRETFADSRAVREGVLQRAAIDRLLDEHRTRRADHHVRIWMLLNVELWLRHALAGEPVAALAQELRGRLPAGIGADAANQLTPPAGHP
jgi:asparagine synthase (glutamine-hydrolysing)